MIIIYIQYIQYLKTQRSEGFEGFKGLESNYSLNGLDYSKYNNLSLTSKPVFHNLPDPVYVWWNKIGSPWGLVKKYNINNFKPIGDNKINSKTQSKSPYNLRLYGNSTQYCNIKPYEYGCPNNWLY